MGGILQVNSGKERALVSRERVCFWRAFLDDK